MRLTQYEITAIKEAVYMQDKDALIYIFGSRTDDEARGGDIDILVISDKLIQRDARIIKECLYEKIGEQKIDLLIARDASHPFTRIALKTGVRI